jgi:transposase
VRGAYQSVISEWLPNADIVNDRFHLMMNVNQAVDWVRRSQWRQASGEGLSFSGVTASSS